MSSPPESPEHPVTEETLELPDPLRSDRTIGPYKVLSRLGAGGMGEVYLAADARLGRKIALKVLPAHLTSEPQSVRRFVREAKAASALNHPNIITIYDIGEADSNHYIVMEHIQGQTLRQLMAAGLTVATILDIAIQTASALQAAHEAGIVHRDIKPENVMMRPDGLVKVLDFGIAKLTERPSPVVTGDYEKQESLGIETTGEVTTAGIIVGTVSYMSPEQILGQKIDTRTDIFSLGTMLYEVIAGKSPFYGQSQAERMAAILEREPAPLASLRPDVPSELQRILNKALHKDREARYQKIDQMLIELKELKRELEFQQNLGRSGATNISTVAPQTDPPSQQVDAQTTSSSKIILGELKRHRRGFTLALIVFIAVIAGAGWWLYSLTAGRSLQPGSAATAFEVLPFTSLPGNESLPFFSPDGNRIAFSWNGSEGDNTDIYIKQVGTEDLQRLTTDPAADFQPRWSPDGLYIAFLRQTDKDYGLYLMPSIGGRERLLTRLALVPPMRFDILQVSWSPDGQWLAISDRPSPQEPFSILTVSCDSGERRRLTSPPAEITGDLTPAVSPDGKMIAFKHFESGGISEIYLVPVAGGESKRLTFSDIVKSSPAWTPDGRDVLFLSESGSNIGLWRVPAAGGTPERVEAVGQAVTSFAISPQRNRLAWTQTINDSNIWQVDLSAVAAPTGLKPSAKMLISSTKGDVSSQFSPDGKRIALASTRSGRSAIWVADSTGEQPVQVASFVRGAAGSPRWSPDGQWLVFDGRVEGNADIYVISPEGGKPRRLTTEPSEDVVPSFSRDGQWVYFCSNRSGTRQIWKMPAAGGEALRVTQGGGFDNVESVDGQFLYYAKERGEAGIWRVPVAGGEESLVLDQHRAGLWRQWAAVEQGIFFITAENPDRPLIEFFSFASGKVSVVLALQKRLPDTISGLSVSPDGRRLIWTQLDEVSSDINLIENFR